MERHLGTFSMHTPASHDVVLPNLPIPVVDLDAEGEPHSGNERIVSAPHAVSADRGLERLSPTRIAELRMRLETGAYNSAEVMTELAMRLLESGDL